MKDIDELLAKLEKVKPIRADQWKALCPGHHDTSPSLSVKLADDKILLKCFGGCELMDIIKPLGLEPKDLFIKQAQSSARKRERKIVAIYNYVDASGKPFEVVRTDPKGFYQRQPDVKGGYINNLNGIVATLYHQADIEKAVKSGETIFIVEGEKDADNLWACGLIATTNPGGSEKWCDRYTETLKGAKLVVAIPDKDIAGYKHARNIANAIYEVVSTVKILDLPGENTKDISDWLTLGGDAAELETLVTEAPPFQPQKPSQPDMISPAASMFPRMPESAWQGLFKQYLELVEGTTEAADAFHYATFCQVLGATLGRRIFVYHATRLYPNFYICLVGRTGLTRKDTCWARAKAILDRLHADSEMDELPLFRTVKGLRSYEGLLDELKGEKKVRLIQFSELLSLLLKAKQDSMSNIIPQLTELYDCPDRVNPPVHQNMVDCREPFVSIMAGTTLAWLQKALTDRDIYGGFANRWLYFCGVPKEPKPNPPRVDKQRQTELVSAINTVRKWADDFSSQNEGEIAISEEAESLFADYYHQYYGRCQGGGLIPTLIVRIQDYIWKLSLLYAAMEYSETILPRHLEPAIAAGNFLEKSVAQVFSEFGASRGKESELRILEILQDSTDGVPTRELYRQLNISAFELERTITPLIKVGLVRNFTMRTKAGRNVDTYTLV